MRVITGIARGRKLKEPEGMDIRPTADQVKESVFNIIQGDVEGRSCLDLFSGTGQMGIEALSRGAAGCVFVDADRTAVKLTKLNLEKTGLQGQVFQADALRFLESREKYDLIFIDPPYRSDLYGKVLQRIKDFDKLHTGGIMVVESSADFEPESPGAPYCKLRSYRYGKVRITTFTKSEGLEP